MGSRSEWGLLSPIFHKLWILENAGPHFEWGLLSWFFDQIRIFANPKEILKNVCPPIESGFGPNEVLI